MCDEIINGIDSSSTYVTNAISTNVRNTLSTNVTNTIPANVRNNISTNVKSAVPINSDEKSKIKNELLYFAYTFISNHTIIHMLCYLLSLYKT